tara:strand:- start:138 stop:338 length:201 start_codon:yes stop_codon:yes gene_type:complete
MVSIYDVTPDSTIVVGWICEECGNHYKMRVCDRVQNANVRYENANVGIANAPCADCPACRRITETD